MLTVYKASAGSGKTFRLAVEYIKRLIIDPYSYERTLAVTFTNKATEEMKMRILSQLYGLAHNLDSSKGYMEVIMDDLNKSNPEGKHYEKADISRRADIALSKLLHNYSFFRVETIDKFFQNILRNLARELDLTPNLRVELSAKEIIHRSVNTWIDSLKENNKELTWILDYIHDNMDVDKRWNVIDQIKQFGEQLLNDDYKEHSRELNERLEAQDKDFYRHYTSELRAIVNNANQNINKEADALWQIILSHGLDEDSFTQKKKGVGAFIRKMASEPISSLEPNSYVCKAFDPDDTEAANWTSKKTSQAIKDICRDILRPRFITLIQHFKSMQIEAKTATVTLNHMYELRMLHAIQQEVNRSNAQHDRFLLSDTQNLLSRMIDGSDSPFIFEKTGARLQSIMIDEFQDTSRIQWSNFKVLLDDCLSHGHDSLIVGDVKQSIYRWRSGDWRLLNNIGNQFSQPINEQSLTVNRRSSTRIIDFNNAFFTTAAQLVYNEAAQGCKPEDAEMLRRAYADVCQQYPDNSLPNGYVEVRLLDKDDYQLATLNYISSTIASLIEHGAKQKDIAVLVRTNRQISEIALHCTNAFKESDSELVRNLRVVSDEGFLLKASPAVCIIIDAIRLLLNPNDKIVRSRLSVNYQRYILKLDLPQQRLLENLLLPEDYLNGIQQLITMPLYQLCEQIIVIFNLSSLPTQNAYICYFLDCVSEFLTNTIGDLSAFINLWDETLANRSVESDSDNGIRILSIHKSKGLEYKHVIIPFCDWTLEQGSLLWCVPTSAPYNQLPLIPLDFSKKALTSTIYEPYYWEEHMQNLVDNINLLYVGFTRAKDGLYITTQAGQKESSRGKIIEDSLQQVADALIQLETDAGRDGSIVTMEPGLLTYGMVDIQQKTKKDKKETNVFLQQSQPLQVAIATSSHEPVFVQSNQSRQFTLTDEDADEQTRQQYIQLGNVLHSLFASIRYADDIPVAILQMEMDGLLSGQDITADAIRQHIEYCMSNPQIADWFSHRWTLHNECNILTYDAKKDVCKEQRPDRVMSDGEETIVVDFKLFTYKEGYRTQVQDYMSLLKRMGYKNVKGYLWLVMSNKIIPID